MNNKALGNKFEREMVDLLAARGYWAHFIVPDAGGRQPFDIIACKDGVAYAIDCKTCVADKFSIGRLEQNQIFAFEKWLQCGNREPILAVKHNDKVYLIPYRDIKAKKSVKIENYGGF